MKRKRLVKWMLLAAFSVILITIAGLIYQSIASAIDRRRYPPPGKMVDIGGYRLHLNCTGNKLSGDPTIIAESGSIGNSLTWARIQPEVSQHFQMCVYDRAGLGWSDPGPTPRTGRQLASELHTLLQKAGITGPFVLVGHSLGGLYVRLYASQYPDDIVGIILVDSVHEDQYTDAQKERNRFIELYLARIGAQTGFFRLVGTLGLSARFEKIMNSAPAEVAAANRSFYYRPETWITGAAEAEAVEENRQQLRNAGTLGDIPLVVLSAPGDRDDDEETRRMWDENQVKLAALSRHHRHVVVYDSSHFIQLDKPDLVIRTIRNIAEAGRAPSSTNSLH